MKSATRGISSGTDNGADQGDKLEILEFDRIIRVGLGRAIIVLQENDPRPFGEAILNVCLHNLNFDRQFEESRSQYVWDLIRLSGDPARFRSEVLAALQTTQIGYDLDQLFQLAQRFAAEGDGEARAGMYSRFASNAANPSLDASDLRVLTSGAEDLIWLDGVDGFLFVVEKLGQRLLTDPSLEATDYWWTTDYWLELLEQKVGTKRARQAIKQARQQSEPIAAYLRLIDDDTRRDTRLPKYTELGTSVSRTMPRLWKHKEPGPARISYDELKEMIAIGEPPDLSLPAWARWADPGDIEQAARDLLVEQDARRLHAYLRIFTYQPFPFDPQRLITLAQRDDPKIGRQALYALDNIQHAKVRELALAMLASPARANSDWSIHLLTRNYQPGDHELIRRRLAAERDIGEYHMLGKGALRVFEANPVPECVGVLTMLYENGPCTLCRESCVDLLHTMGRMPDWMMRECRYDANEGLREKVRFWLSATAEQKPLP